MSVKDIEIRPIKTSNYQLKKGGSAPTRAIRTNEGDSNE